jgi:hypothetical protein
MKTENNRDGDLKAISHLKEAVAEGKHWYIALLEAIKLWESTEENYRNRHYHFLIDDEAFDWLLLAERLLLEIIDIVPEKERVDLLFFDKPPVTLSREDFKKLIGTAKYKAYLNYTYGVLVEEALLFAVVDEVRKERRSQGSMKDEGVVDKAYERIYGDIEQKLLNHFLKAKGYTNRKTISLDEFKEFLYWLFKYRITNSDKSKVASDTKKALIYLQKITLFRQARH